MRLRGLEPPRACAHGDLNAARLPIPPQPRNVQNSRLQIECGVEPAQPVESHTQLAEPRLQRAARTYHAPPPPPPEKPPPPPENPPPPDDEAWGATWLAKPEAKPSKLGVIPAFIPLMCG